MNRIRQTQKGYIVAAFILPGCLIDLVIALLLITNPDTRILGFVLLAMVPLLLILLWIFSSLTVEISADRLRFWFGPGLFGKTIELRRIVSANSVRNQWWHGWGIHWYGGGILYNVSGFESVEIRLDNGKQLRIGSDNPTVLAEHIQSTIRSNTADRP